MDFKRWESRNLARSILAQLYSQVIHRYDKDMKKAERHRLQAIAPEQPRNYTEASQSSVNYRRSARRVIPSNSNGSMVDDDEEGFMFPHLKPIQFSRRCSFDDSVAFLPDSAHSTDSQTSLRRTQSTAALEPYSLMIDRPSWYGSTSVAYYRRFARFPSRDKVVEWMPSIKFTTESGRQKIIEYIRKQWLDGVKMKFAVDYICAVPLPGIIRHKYAATFYAKRYSSSVYFSIDVSTVYVKNPVIVTFTFPDAKRAHRLDTPRTHFEEFLRRLYPYGREK